MVPLVGGGDGAGGVAIFFDSFGVGCAAGWGYVAGGEMVWVVVFGVDGRVWTGLFSAAPCPGLSAQRACAGGGNCGGGASCILARAGVEWRSGGFKRAS